jgi:hypothetical protein
MVMTMKSEPKHNRNCSHHLKTIEAEAITRIYPDERNRNFLRYLHLLKEGVRRVKYILIPSAPYDISYTARRTTTLST